MGISITVAVGLECDICGVSDLFIEKDGYIAAHSHAIAKGWLERNGWVCPSCSGKKSREYPMTLYNCKTEGDSYRITKFSDYLDVESSYLTTLSECECPAGVRPTCRHRHMLRRFMVKGGLNGEWFHEYETQKWLSASLQDGYEAVKEPKHLGTFQTPPEPEGLPDPEPTNYADKSAPNPKSALRRI